MGFDGVFTTAMAGELESACRLSKIEKIYQPGKDELVLHLRGDGERRLLYFSNNASHPGLFLIDQAPENPPQPGGFCMLLRKHIQGGRILSLVQKECERILEIEIETRDEMQYSVSKVLIAEIMGKHSNLVLVDKPTGKVIDAMRRIPMDVSRQRQLIPGLPYESPPDQGKLPFTALTKEALVQMLEGPNPEKTILDRVQGFSPVLVRQLVFWDEADAAWNWFSGVSDALAQKRLHPVVFLDSQDAPLEFHAFPLPEYQGQPFKDFEYASEAVRYYYGNRANSDRNRQQLSSLIRVVQGALKRNLLKQKRLSEDLLVAQEAKKYRHWGELLTANLHQPSAGLPKIRLLDYTTDEEIEIPVDQRKSMSQNAQSYFRKYQKSKRTITERLRLLEEAKEEQHYLESVEMYLEDSKDPSLAAAIREELHEGGYLHGQQKPRKKKKWEGSPSRYWTADGFELLVGRNNQENDYITFHVADKNDLWFHVKDFPGAHVVLRTRGQEVSPFAMEEAASLAAYFSKGGQAEKTAVDMTKARYVKKPSGARPGQCIFTRQQTFQVKPAVPGSTGPSFG